MANAAFDKKKIIFTSKLEIKISKKLIKPTFVAFKNFY